tara:strand:- start:142 stop:1035 length:894 start_codon:yes stop_codon:yes gene_type:complete
MLIFLIILAISVLIFFASKSNSKKELVKPKQPSTFKKSKWELVTRNSDRWFELGYGDGSLFPGYGKIYNREYKVWYCEVGSKDEKGVCSYEDTYPIHYTPKDYELITGSNIALDSLEKTRGFEALYTGLDHENRKRWYFGLVKSTPTWIETDRALEGTLDSKVKKQVEIPDGLIELVYNSNQWNKLGLDKAFPGYGELYESVFKVWYVPVGTKDDSEKIDVKAYVTFYGNDRIIRHFDGVTSQVDLLKNSFIQFDQLKNTKGYNQLYSGLEGATKRRWYIGLKESVTTRFFAVARNE